MPGTKNNNKLIIVTAPSGAGKTTIVRHLLAKYDELAFSVSATTREKRPHEAEGKDYYFISQEAFKKKIANGEFIEFQEVYAGQFYGTLQSEVDRLWNLGKHVVFDIDVKGAENVKRIHPDNSLAIFIKPPNREVLLERLKARKTEDEESLKKRIAKSLLELKYENRFDRVLINDKLDKAFADVEEMVEDFLEIRKSSTDSA